MNKFKCVSFMFVFVLGCATIIGNVKSQTSSAIPEIIQSCYRGNFTITSKPPFTMQLLVEIINKIEVESKNSVNMRTLATSMLHGVLFNGIRRTSDLSVDENIIPYRATAAEFYNYKVITDYLIPGQIVLFPRESLSVPQLCLLHFIISSTVDPSERGDESSTCNERSSMPLEMGELNARSSCPLQRGIVKTKWGSVLATHLITGIAAGLQPNPVTFSRVVEGLARKEEGVSITAAPILPLPGSAFADNLWVATIAGDLARAILKQVNGTPEIGTPGFWNDSVLPRTFYLKSDAWDMTEARILAGIDGAVLGSHIKEWINVLDSIRLSQVLDMYYSERGIPFNFGYRANNRSVSFNSLLHGVNLTEQIIGSGKLLQAVGRFGVSIADDALTNFAGSAASHFEYVAGKIANDYDKTEYLNGKQMKAPIELIIILDGTFDYYRAQQMIYSLSEAIQVSYHGSKLGVINGQSGNWMVNVTREVYQIFSELNDPKDGWPATLSLSTSLRTVISHYQHRASANCSTAKLKPFGQAVLVFSQQGRLDDVDVERSTLAVRSIKAAFPATRMVYVTPRQLNPFGRLLREGDSTLGLTGDVVSIVHQVAEVLSTVPADVVRFHCDGGRASFEDYVTPGLESFYEVHRGFIVGGGSIDTKFVNSNYGDLVICAFRSTDAEDRACRVLTVNQEFTINSRDFCTPDIVCDLRFAVTANSSRFRCAETDCRYPDQVRMDIHYTYTAGGSVFTANILFTVLITSVLIVIH